MGSYWMPRVQNSRPEVKVNPGGGSGWDEPPLDIQIPDDARELDREVLAYRRELRAQRRRQQLQRLAGPFAGRGTVMPVLASILAVCLVAGAMLSVATFSPATAPAVRSTSPAATTAPARPSSPAVSSPAVSSPVLPSRAAAGKPARAAASARPAPPHRPSGSAAPFTRVATP